MIAYLALIWLDWLGRLTPPAHCPDFVDDFDLTWTDYAATHNILDDPDAIECGRMYVEHCWKLPARTR